MHLTKISYPQVGPNLKLFATDTYCNEKIFIFKKLVSNEKLQLTVNTQFNKLDNIKTIFCTLLLRVTRLRVGYSCE